MKRMHALGALGALTIAYSASAEPVVIAADFDIDKPEYSYGYAIGVGASIVSDVPIRSVQVTHNPRNGGSAGQWSLTGWYGSWWGWSPTSVSRNAGFPDGTLSIVATDDLGAVSAAKVLTIPADAETAFPSMTVSRTSRGFEIAATPVAGADRYYLWLWDAVDGFYPNSQEAVEPTLFAPIPTMGLVSGRTYDLYLLAVNVLDAGQFRSYTLKQITYDAAEVLLEELAVAAAGAGPGKSLSRKLDSARTYYAAPDVPATCAVLLDFSSEVRARRGKNLSVALADKLTTDAAAIVTAIGCS